jgi:hypothetical protein
VLVDENDDEHTGYNLLRDRTAEPSALGFPTCHLGSMKVSADTALSGVTKRVIVRRGLFFVLLFSPSDWLTMLRGINSSSRDFVHCSSLTPYSYAEHHRQYHGLWMGSVGRASCEGPHAF